MNNPLAQRRIFKLNLLGIVIPVSLHIVLYGFGQDVMRLLAFGAVVACGIYAMNAHQQIRRDRSQKMPNPGQAAVSGTTITERIQIVLPCALCVMLCVAIWQSQTFLAAALLPISVMCVGLAQALFVVNRAQKRG